MSEMQLHNGIQQTSTGCDVCLMQNPTKRRGGILYKLQIKISDKTKGILQIAWLSLKIKLERLKKRSRLPLSIIVFIMAMKYLFQFYDVAPTWAKAMFMFCIWRQMGQMVSGWK